MKHFFRWLQQLFSKQNLRSSDTGLFDPFLPIASVKKADDEQSFDQIAEDADPFFSEQVMQRRQFMPFKLILVLIVAGVVFRLTVLQISQGQANYQLAEGNRLKAEAVIPARGLFLDRNGVALVKNVPNFSVVLSPQEVPTKQELREEFITRVSSALTLDSSAFEKTVDETRTRDVVTLLEGLDRETALSVELRLNGIEGVDVVKTPSRLYSSVPGLGHILGYIGKVDADDLEQRDDLLPTSLVGKTGLEQTYDRELQGRPGIETLEVDSLGRKIRSVGVQPARPGQTLVLTIDAAVQEVAAKSLQEAIEKNGATSGAAVALDPRSGDVLAMVSAPFFDNNIFSRAVDQEQRKAVLANPLSPLVNRAISGQYPSGSTIKPVVAAAALQEKVITPTTKIDTSEGKITIGQWTFPDWKTHGVADVKQAIAESNNIFFYTIGGGHKNIGGLGVERLASYLEKFGFGKPTGVDLPGETKGLVPRPDWKKKVKKESWYIGDTYNLAIGQGDFLLTPLQLTRATAAIANGGTLYQPKFIKSILSSDETETRDFAPKQQTGQVVSAEALSVVRDGMRQTVLNGSARSFSALPIPIAAKTGTAQFSIGKEKTHSWFTAFAPFDNPEIAISVIVEGGGEGFSVAAPVAKNIFEQYFRLPLTPIVPAVTME